MTPVDLIISTVQAGDTLLQSAVCCGTAMAEVMTDFVLLEAAEDVFSSKQSGERSSSNTAPTCSLRISWMPLSRGRL